MTGGKKQWGTGDNCGTWSTLCLHNYYLSQYLCKFKEMLQYATFFLLSRTTCFLKIKEIKEAGHRQAIWWWIIDWFIILKVKVWSGGTTVSVGCCFNGCLTEVNLTKEEILSITIIQSIFWRRRYPTGVLFEAFAAVSDEYSTNFKWKWLDTKIRFTRNLFKSCSQETSTVSNWRLFKLIRWIASF